MDPKQGGGPPESSVFDPVWIPHSFVGRSHEEIEALAAEDDAMARRFIMNLHDIAEERVVHRASLPGSPDSLRADMPRQMDAEYGVLAREVDEAADAYRAGIDDRERRADEYRESSAASLASMAAELAATKDDAEKARALSRQANVIALISAAAAVGAVIVSALSGH